MGSRIARQAAARKAFSQARCCRRFGDAPRLDSRSLRLHRRDNLTVARLPRTMTVMCVHHVQRSALAVVMICLASAMATAVGAFVLGGGNADKDCRVAFGGVEATDGESGVVCTDGDSCDA